MPWVQGHELERDADYHDDRELTTMYGIADWGKRKREIGTRFRMATLDKPLPAETDTAAYIALMDQMNISSVQDLAILYSIVEDAIMMAGREERPAEPLEMFKSWLQQVRNNHIDYNDSGPTPGGRR